MIVQRRKDGLLLFAQPDHAALAGEFAQRWGNESFWRPGQDEALLVAARHHDDGWALWEAAPGLSEFGSPVDFLTTPMEERVQIYRRCVDMAAGRDLHAGILVSLHFAGLFLGRFEPGAFRVIDSLQGRNRELVQKFIAEQERWRHEADEGGSGGVALDNDLVMAEYRLLQIFDLLSLVVCMQPLDEISNQTFDLVPTTGAETGRIKLKREGTRLILDPYPLDSAPLHFSIKGRALDRHTFNGGGEFRGLYEAAPLEEVAFSLDRAG
jgi:uncharacterized protein DUF3891